MPNVYDIACLGFVTIIATLIETFVFFPRFKADVASGRLGARTRGYRRAIIGQWVLTILLLGTWARVGRPWSALGFVPPTGWRIVVGFILAGIVVGVALQQIGAIRRVSRERLDAIRPKIADVEFILPHTLAERRWFMLLSCTAGFCEEVLYRGYLIWVIGAFVGVPGAVVTSVVLFGAGHAYQGRKGIVKTSLAGLAMALVYVASGWLIPGMIIHAVIDANSGALAYRVFGPEETSDRGSAVHMTETFSEAQSS